ncbi:MAG: sugar nucleotide-binding protein, partial [Candidatus Omnitrophica bacterium]|nr:sugar nucleotide-binding protein [Candidatus Omnitrophota bacterium]
GKNFVDTILTKSKREGLLKVVDDQVGSPTYTKDLAKAIRALTDKKIMDFGIYHVSNSGGVSWYKYAKAILNISGIKAKVVPISSKELAKPARRPAMSVMDNSKFEKVTGYRMRGSKSALQEYLN